MVVHPASHGDSSCPVVLWIQLRQLEFRVRGSHPLRRAFPGPSTTLIESHMLSSTPQILLLAVWPPARSLATTCAISFDFSSSPYLDVSVRAVPFLTLFGSRKDTQACPCVGFPIRIPTDQCVFAAPRGFSQLVASFFGSWCQGIPLVLFVA